MPQAPGMWLTVALRQAASVTELQFDSMVSMRGGGQGRGGGDSVASAPVVGYPRGYSLQVSMDGTTWSKPVAVGKGSGPRTTITFAPTQARFIRITQTDTTADAPAWSVRNLRVYEVPTHVSK